MLNAGIPSLDAVKYAVSFFENDIEMEHLATLNADFLKMLDVKKSGEKHGIVTFSLRILNVLHILEIIIP